MSRVIEKHKALLCAVIFVLILCTVFFSVQGVVNVAYAAETSNEFDSTNVLDDLRASTVDGEAFDLRDYPYNEKGQIRIVNFVEYCYSYKANMQGNYGLYVYIYNPQGLNLSTNSKQNKIQMAVSYASDETANRYEKFELQFCNKSDDADYKNLFYKYKVVDRPIDGKTFVNRVNSNERRYDVSGVELLTYGQQNATEYTVGGTYRFTGYSEGYGNDATAKSTLSCVVEDLETCELKVYHTHYRTNVSSLGKSHYNQVNTVYFEMPKRLLDDYGTLQKIRAEWWEYKTKMAAVTSNTDFYKQLDGNKGYLLSEHDSSTSGASLFDSRVPYRLTANNHIGYGGTNWYDWSYNFNPYYGTQSTSTSRYYAKLLPLVFYSEYANSVDNVLDFLYSQVQVGDIAATEVAKKIYEYKNGLGNGYIDCNGRQISKDVFENGIDETRTAKGVNVGYNDITLDLDEDKFDLRSFDSQFANNSQKILAKLFTYGFSWPETDGDYYNVAPIKVLEAADLVGTNEAIADKLLVSRDDVSDIQALYAQATTVNPLEKSDEEKVVVLFRFAVTDYYCAEATRTVPDSSYAGYKSYTGDTYVAQQTVFLDFDIIELTFNKDGVYKVIPVVASPIDVINGFTAPPASLDWWKLLLGVLALVLLLILLAPVLPYIIQAIIWVIKLPFKAIGAIAKSNKHSLSKSKSKKE